MKRKIFVTGTAVFLIVVATAIWYAREQTHAAPTKPTMIVSVGTEAVQEMDVPVYLDALGSVTPRRSVKVTSQVNGVLLQTPVREGAKVRKGQIIAIVDSRETKAKLKQVKGNLKRDEALLSNAKLDLERYRGALRDGSGNQQAVDTQKALVEQFRGAVMNAQGAIDELNIQIGYSLIRSPIDGRIGLRQIDPGNVLRADNANALAVIESVRPTTVMFSVPEDQLPRLLHAFRIDKHMNVKVFDRDKKKELGQGSVLAVDNRVDAATGTVNVKALFDNDDGRLYPNQFVNVSVQVALIKAAMVVPSGAVRHGRNGDYVFTVSNEQTAVMHSVKVGAVTQGYTVVKSGGLKPGDVIVVEGADRLDDKARVQAHPRRTVLPATAPPQEETASRQKNTVMPAGAGAASVENEAEKSELREPQP